MFRWGAAFNPAWAFANGAKSVTYMGVEMTRRHCASTRSALLTGYINPTKFLSSSAAASGATSAISAMASQVAAASAVSMSVGDALEMSYLSSVIASAASTPFAAMSFFAPSGRCCGTIPLHRLAGCCEEFDWALE